MHRFVAFLCCWVLVLPALAQGYAVKRLHFTNYRTSNGLSSNYIVDMAVDAHGFLWLATDCGVNRFDGAAFRSYRTDNYPSLLENDALQVCPVSAGGVLVSGYNGFLQRYDYATDRFEPVFPRSFTQTVGNLYYDSLNDDYFALTTGGIYRKKHGADGFSKDFLPSVSDRPTVQRILNDGHGHYWLAESDSVSVFSADGRLVLVLRPSSSHIQTFTPQLMSLSDGRLMVSYQTNKVDFFSFSSKGDIVHERSVTLPFLNLTCVQVTTDGAYWFASDGDGLWYSPSEPVAGADLQKVLPYGSNGDEIRKVYSLLADSLGNLWVATQNAGLWRYSAKDLRASFMSSDLGIPRGVGTGFCELPSKCMMMACDGSGLYEFSENAGLLQAYSETDGLKNRNLISLMCDSRGQVWASTWGAGLYLGNSQGGRYAFKPVDFTGLDNPQTTITNCLELDNGDVWACSGGDGVYIRHDGKWSRTLLRYPWNKDAIERWPVFSIEVNDREHWVQTSCCMWNDRGGGMLKPYNIEKFMGPERYIINDAVYVPGCGVVLATQKGLLVAKSDTFSFSKVDCCPEVDIHSIVLDQKGRLWATLPDGVWCFNLQQRTSFRYPKDFGAYGRNYFVKHSKFCNSRNFVYFGTKDGFFCFNGDSLPTVRENSDFCLNRIEVDGEQIDFGTLFVGQSTAEREVELPYGHSSLAVCVDMADFSQQRAVLVYRLGDADWQSVNTDQRIAFNYLPSGNYLLEVKLLGTPDSCAIKLKVVVLGPWWQSLWFKALCVLLIVLLIGYKIYRMQRDRRALRDMVDERTRELKIQKDLVELRNQELNVALSTKDRLMTVVAHDLKNPVFAIVGALEGLRRRNHQLTEEERASSLDSMIDRTRTLQNELGKLLVWATSKQDEVTFRPSNADLAEIIGSDVELLKIQAEEKGVALHCSVDVPNYVYVDSRMVATAIRNVLGNSLKFTPPGCAVRVRAWQEGASAFVEVVDEGVGMSAEKLQELLAKDVNASTVGTGGESGSGLGVGLAKYYVATNGGHFSMSSEVGSGTTTLLELPATQIPVAKSTAGLEDQTVAVEVDAELLEGNCVLVVDDDPLIAQNIKSMLEKYVEVLLAKDGQEALGVVRSHSVDVVVSDVEMPVMNGIEMSNALKSDANYNHIPVLFLSARTTESDRLLGLLTGAVDYIPKPFNWNELLVKLNNILSVRQRQQQYLLNKAVADGSLDAAGEERADKEGNTAEKMNPYLQKVLADIEAHFSDSEYSVELLASNLCTTRITLYRKVKSLSGQNPSDLLIDYRLNKSCQLLKEKQMPVQDVAYAVGFSDYAYFSRRFKARFGQSPKDFAAL